ncbi:MAG TPA: TetR/AcrR family transcriptional regulator [Acidimicrobiales bacterium]
MNPRSAERPRTPKGQGDRLRGEILDATRRLLLQAGDVAEVSVRAIAAEVGVTAPSIYRHFETKDELIFAVCEESFAELDRRSSAAADEEPDPLSGLAARGRAYVHFGLEHPEQYRLLFMTRAAFEGDDASERLRSTAAFDHLVHAVDAAIDAKALRPDLDPFTVAIGLWASSHGLTSLLIAKPQFPWPPVDNLIEHTLTASLAGLLPTS